MRVHRLVATVATIGLAVLAVSGAGAQPENYPTRHVVIVTPSGAGAGPDVVMRIVADRLTQIWGQQVQIINRSGGGGIIAAQAANTAPRDGYNLYLPFASTFVVLPEVQPKMPLDVNRDIVPIALVGQVPMVISASSSLGVSTLPELIALAKKRPKQLLYGTLRGGFPHLTMEMFARRAGIELNFVPYSASPKALTDVIGGTLQLFVEAMPATMGAVQGGSLRPLAVASAMRLPDFPDLPTVSETIPGFEATAWFALTALAGTPEGIVRKVNNDLNAVLEQPDVQRKLEALGTYPRITTPAETAKFIRSEQELWRPVVRQLGLASQ
jgi:tripartite-type tricarboxylate transporter receptor subunit TctC